MTDSFDKPASERYFEDYLPGAVYEFGTVVVDQSEIVEFAKAYDPQPFHVDVDAARHSVFGGLIASGWHTAGMMMRLFVRHFLPAAASLGSPGVDELRWLQPVRPGDTLRIRVTITAANPSRSKPDRGVVHTFIEVLNQADAVVMRLNAAVMMLRASE